MGSKFAIPAITQQEFDAIESQIRADLAAWWEQESQDFDALVLEGANEPSEVEAATASVWGGMPEIDSKAVVKASPIIKKHLGVELDPKHIKKGGYDSVQEFVDDLIPKLRAQCPVSVDNIETNPAQKELSNVQ